MSEEKSYATTNTGRRRERDVRGARYSVTEWGDPSAPLIVYLHGWGDTGSTFQFVVDALAGDWFVIAPDWRGFGRSRVACASYWFPDYLADLHELAAIYSPEDPLRVVGHSMGANVAGLYAGVFPERVRAFVNIEGFGLADADPADAPQRYRRWIDDGVAGPSFASFKSIAALAEHIRGRNPRMSAGQADFVAREWAIAGDEIEIELRADPLHKLPNPVLYRRAEAEACWQAIEAEVLLVTGGDSDLARRFASVAGASCPGDRRESIADAGHMLHFEAPAALADTIESFLRQHL